MTRTTCRSARALVAAIGLLMMASGCGNLTGISATLTAGPVGAVGQNHTFNIKVTNTAGCDLTSDLSPFPILIPPDQLFFLFIPFVPITDDLNRACNGNFTPGQIAQGQAMLDSFMQSSQQQLPNLIQQAASDVTGCVPVTMSDVQFFFCLLQLPGSTWSNGQMAQGTVALAPQHNGVFRGIIMPVARAVDKTMCSDPDVKSSGFADAVACTDRITVGLNAATPAASPLALLALVVFLSSVGFVALRRLSPPG
ncbi:MAG: hypothetical protein HYR72_20180 [Deltaproteobacteria bacterium]|nr:hypothetical protein [Deltaproteobacteria bacterium]MBI3389429.1 hypothetical protein [Deltaproteobacteria bacterium]